jgi:large subunit ribosomal protein L3
LLTFLRLHFGVVQDNNIAGTGQFAQFLVNKTKVKEMKYILGKKIGMSQMYDKNGRLTPVTLILAGPCNVLQKKTKEKEGYEALQIGFKKIEKKDKIGKSMKGKEYKYIREEVINEKDEAKVGDEINVSVFAEGDKIKVSGTSKGKGFQGGVKKHGFHGRNATHGVKHEHRTIGSTGTRFPQHVMKGRRMPGRMGYDRISVKGLKIIKIVPENNLLVVRGAVPGVKGALLEIRAQ